MKTNGFFIGMAALLGAVALWGCSADEAGELQEARESMPTTVSLTTRLTGTRVANDPQTSAINSDVQVGVFGVSGSATITNGDNGCYTVESTGSLTPKSKKAVMGWPADGSKVSIYAYAPYNSAWTHNADNSFTISSDQSTSEGYLASDLLYGAPASNPVEPTAKAVALTFSHKLAKVNIAVAIKENSAISFDLTKARVTINNTKPTTSLNPSTGALGTATGSVADIIASTALGSPSTVYTIVVPQTIAKNTILVTIETNPTGTDNRTYRAKLKQDVTFESGKAYSFKVVLDEDPEPALTLQMGGTSITGWNDNNGVSTTTKEVPSIGDYILADGKFLKPAASDFAAKKSQAIAVIFSTSVSNTDAAAGYEGYAMGVKSVSGKDWGGTAAWNETNISTWAAALSDLDGLTHCKNFMAGSNPTWTGLTAGKQAKFIANFTGFSLQFTTVPDNLSGWFVPSIGQWILILNNLGGAGLDANTTYANGNTSSPGLTSTETNVFARIDACLTQAGQSALGESLYVSSTESDNNFWQVSKASTGYNIGRNPGKASNTRNVVPVIAYKVPAE